MEFSEKFADEAGELMESILADADESPTITPFLGLGTDDPAGSIYAPDPSSYAESPLAQSIHA